MGNYEAAVASNKETSKVIGKAFLGATNLDSLSPWNACRVVRHGRFAQVTGKNSSDLLLNYNHRRTRLLTRNSFIERNR